MSRSLSSTFVQAVNAAETDEVFLVLLTVNHEDLAAPLKVTSDSVETTKSSSAGGDTYDPFPFEIELPLDDEDLSGALARLRIDAVDRSFVEAVRRIGGVPKVDVEIVLASDPDTVEATWPTFALSNGRYDATTIEGDLVLEVFAQEPFPGDKMDPGLFPGLF